jgi:chemotaxis protein methyltransferase CheR
MRDAEFADFLRWALPRLRLRWEGFRRVRGQVRKRVARRMQELGVPDAAAYRNWLAAHPEEWDALDALCRITISRFWRDRGMFEFLARDALPRFAAAAGEVRVWSAGCANGEEPYSVALLWRIEVQPRFRSSALRLLATDADPALIARARAACYGDGSFRELPAGWREIAFERRGSEFCLKPEFRAGVEFAVQDVRREMPEGPFHVVLCRNVVFLYFAAGVQRRVAAGLRERLAPGGVLLVGRHEELPPDTAGFAPLARGVYSAV